MFIWILPLLAVVLILGYQRASLPVMTIGVSVLLVVLSILARPSWAALIIIWMVWIVIALVLNIRPLRRWLISKRILSVVARNAPTFSPTEQAVLLAGNTGWEAELFSGRPDFSKLLDMPWARLSAEEQDFLDNQVDQLCAMVDPWSIHCHQEIPAPVWEYLKKQGFFGLVIPAEYGGKGFSAYAHAQVIMKLASVSAAVATVASVPNSLGPAELLLHYGTEQQKNYYLPRLARGEETPCFALTSPVAGSDAASIIDSGVVCHYQHNGEQKIGIRLNWDKRYITLSPVATLIGLAFRLYDPAHLLGDQEDLGITCALIPATTPGVHTGRHHNPLLCAFPNGPTQGVNVIVNIDAIIGGSAQVGKGWQMLMERLAAGRSISLPSITMGGIKIAAASSGAYARIRRQFNTAIADFGGVQEVLARMAGEAFMAESLRLFSVAQVDQGIHSATAAAISKYHATELGRRVVQGAMDIHGGKGICVGPKNYLARFHIESPIAITVEGANILTRSLIIFGQGILRCHPYLLKEINAVRNNDLKSFDVALFGHLGYWLSNQLRTVVSGLTAAKWVSVPKSLNRYYYRQLSRFSAALATVADLLLMTMGGALKRKEQISARLGDLLSYLYMISGILKHHQTTGENPALLPLVEWSCQELLSLFQQRLTELLNNLPSRGLAWWLRLLIFPLGKHCRGPTDRLTTQVAQSLTQPGAVRDLLMAGAYFGGNLTDLESMLAQMIAAEPLLKKIHGHNNIETLISTALQEQVITAEQAHQLQETEKLRKLLIQVDDFEKIINAQNDH